MRKGNLYNTYNWGVVTYLCNCGVTYFNVNYSQFDHQRHCVTCTKCYEHITVNPEGKIISYKKEQECACYEIKSYKNAEFCCAQHLAILENWYTAGNLAYTVCPKCFKSYELDVTRRIKTACLGILMASKPITKQNYVLHYITWCQVHGFKPLRWDILHDVYYGCESDDDFKHTTEALYIIQNDGFILSFMNDKQLKELDALILKLKIRLELFKRVPSGNNMLLAYALIEEITLKKFNEIQNMDEKLVDKFDKCKSLAISTKHIPERKVAFDRSLMLFKKFAEVEI